MQGIAGSIPAWALLQKKVIISWYLKFTCSPSQTAAWRENQEIQIRRFSENNVLAFIIYSPCIIAFFLCVTILAYLTLCLSSQNVFFLFFALLFRWVNCESRSLKPNSVSPFKTINQPKWLLVRISIFVCETVSQCCCTSSNLYCRLRKYSSLLLSIVRKKLALGLIVVLLSSYY